MKRTTILIAAVAVAGLGLAASIPALAQEPASELATTCPFHDQTDMPYQDMVEWMESSIHNEWMDSPGHGRMHESMYRSAGMMDGYGTGNMMRGLGTTGTFG